MLKNSISPITSMGIHGPIYGPNYGPNYMGFSENVVYPIVPNGFADHDPVFKWLFHWEYTIVYPTFSDKPICTSPFLTMGHNGG